jgi:rhamnulokinase
VSQAAVAAVDLGASGGRVMIGRTGPGRLELAQAHRFANEPVTAGGTLHWDILRLYAGVLDGLRAAARSAPLASIGIDSWGVDYGLLDAAGVLLGNPVHYRDARTDGALDRLAAMIPPGELYAITGIQQLPINTVCQLTAAAGTPQLAAARTLLLIPDLIGYWLTGETGTELTNASTTQLFDVRAQSWSAEVLARTGIPAGLLPALRRPGDTVGELRPEVATAITGNGNSWPNAAAQPGQPGGMPTVVAVGSHDTASAVVGVPAVGRDFAYISCGTWSLVGMELDQPVLTGASRAANFTNETGIDGTIRYLRNVMGLWVLQESMRAWSAAGHRAELAPLLEQAAAAPAFAAVVDVDDPAFLPPGDMPGRIAAACRRTGQPAPDSPGATVRVILDSLALAYRRALADAVQLSGQPVTAVHIVGGGARNTLLCQLTADACGLPVIAGPVEAAALGNVLVQARALGAAPPDLAGMRALLRRTQPLARYEPSGQSGAWAAAARRLN